MTKSGKRTAPGTLAKWWEQLDSTEQRKRRRHYQKLLAKVEQASPKDLIWWHDVGTALLGLFEPTATETRLLYGNRLLALIADELARTSDLSKNRLESLLYNTRRFVEVYPTREDAKRLAKLVHNGDVTMQHVRYLLTVDATLNTKTRSQFLVACRKQKWTANRLYQEIRANKRLLAGSGGRPWKAKAASNPGVAAREMAKLAQRWIASYKAYFQGEDAPLAAVPGEGDQRLLTELETALREMREVAGLAHQGVTELEKAVERVREEIQSDSSASARSATHPPKSSKRK